jgi:hypothetical protein
VDPVVIVMITDARKVLPESSSPSSVVVWVSYHLSIGNGLRNKSFNHIMICRPWSP